MKSRPSAQVSQLVLELNPDRVSDLKDGEYNLTVPVSYRRRAQRTKVLALHRCGQTSYP